MSQQTPETSVAPLRACASVVIPALNEARRIADVVAYAWSDPATAEVIVIDDSSIDETAALATAAGAQVIRSTMLGKGASMQDGVVAASQDVMVFLDGDLAGLKPGIVSDLCRPIVEDHADFVKARFGRGGGRVTELTAKPMLKVFFPEVAHFTQPLGGLIAARRSLLQTLRFADGYGVDVGLLLSAYRAGARLVEVDIGSLEHESQPLADLTAMANEVAHAIYSHAREMGRLHVERVIAMYESQRQATAEIGYILSRQRDRRRLLLIDMDGTLTESRFVVELARASGREAGLAKRLDQDGDAATRSQEIAALFRFLHRHEFERVARQLPIRPDAIEFVNEMRRAGFMVGVVSDSYLVAAEIVRRRVFADFALAHTLQFDNEICNGSLQINRAFRPLDDEAAGEPCKSNVLRRIRAEASPVPLCLTWAVGDNLNDLALLREADRGFAIDPKAAELGNDPRVTVVSSFAELRRLVPGPLRKAA